MSSKLALLLSVLILALFGARAPRAAEREFEIDRVEITGVTQFNSDDIESKLAIAPGDKLERVKIVRTVEDLETLYKIHGYEEVSIRSRLLRKRNEEGTLETVLEFAIHEGRPTRILQIEFVPQGIRDEAFKRYWTQLEPELEEKAGIIPGDVFDQEKISATKRQIQDLLASEEFVGAKVDDVRVATSAPPPAGSMATQRGSVARWVTVGYHIDLGDRVSFGFRGNKAFTSLHLYDLIDKLRVRGFGKDYVTDIKNRIEEEYRSEGYAHAHAKPYSFEGAGQERHITYVIEEGPRVTIDSVDFDGNSAFTDSQLRSQFFSKASVVVQSGYFVESDVQSAAQQMIQWMRDQGYLAAKLVTINPVFPPKPSTQVAGSSVRLIIYLYEGDQTLINSVSISGNHAFGTEEVEKLLNIRPGAPLNLSAFEKGVDALKSAYRAKGYLGMAISNDKPEQIIQYSQENRLADITLGISEGPQYRVSDIQIEGLSITRLQVVQRELPFKQGDVLEEPLIGETEARLRRLGIFSAVTIRVIDDPAEPGYKLVRISVQEATPGIVAGGFGLRNDLGVRLFGQAAYTNLGGRDQTLSLSVAANRRFENYRFVEGSAELLYIWPWFLLPEVTFRPSFDFSANEYLNFDAITYSFNPTWERRLLRNPNLTAAFTYSIQQILQFDAPFPQDNGPVQIGSLIPSLRLDMRDNPLSPTSGLYATTSFEWANPNFFPFSTTYPVSYTRTQFRSDYYLPVIRDIVWFLSFRTGFERNLAFPTVDSVGNTIPQSGQIPLIKQFALGGVDSLRGYQDYELNVQNTAIRGTLSYVNYRTQFDLPFTGSLRFGPFLDAANLLVDQYSFGQLKYSTGVGFHYVTPVGPINLDFGFKLNPEPNTDTSRIDFSIGVI